MTTKRLLIVDDNITNLKQAQALLAGKYDIMLAKSGESALSICAQERPDMVLLDVDMPVMDGFETIKKLKQTPTLAQIPVIFLTASNSTETENRALESGAVDFVTKPINKEILMHRLELHLNLTAYQTSLENVVRELEDNIVISFAELVDCKNDNTGGHVLRTGRYVKLFTDELLAMGKFADELPVDFVNMIVRATPFHDIGKIGISDMLLLKPSPLTEDEFREIEKHTTIGAQLLQTIYERAPSQHYLKCAGVIAEGHHERYDGKGYPKGLSGKDIPLCCRIVSVVNIYDACRTDRVFRKGMSHEEACRAVIEARGTYLDPELVDAFEAVSYKFAELDSELRDLVTAGKELCNVANFSCR